MNLETEEKDKVSNFLINNIQCPTGCKSRRRSRYSLESNEVRERKH